jgi:hypothetical protein
MSSSDPLIVPVEVAAMVLNDPAANLLRAEMHYGQLTDMKSPDPGPFSHDQPNFASDAANRGIYLLWTLPKGLRRQRRSADGDLGAFPLAPNRWLVVRVFRPAAGPPSHAPQVACWVLRSDGIDNDHGGAAYMDPASPGSLTPIRIGIKKVVTSASPWQEPAGATRCFLRAVAEGNPAFAAFQPFNQNVFSFFDDLECQGAGTGTASYYVLGWYSDQATDVLASWPAGDSAGGFAAALTDLGWTADLAEGQTARVSVFQGSAFGVPWQPGGPQPPSPKDGVNPSIAIGATGVDAFVAFVRAAVEQAHPPPPGLTPQQAADLIEAFAYDLLPMLGQAGAEAMLQSTIRGHWFGSAQSGATWTIVDAAQPADTAPTPPTPKELAAEAAWLGPLNQAQAELDELTRQLAGVRRRLFALWWKQQAAQAYYRQSGWTSWPWGIDSGDQFSPVINPVAGQARGLLTQIATLQAAIPAATPTQSLADAIMAFAAAKGLPPTRLLKQVPGARFWAPVDPVAVVSDTRHLMRLDPDGITACRWPAALVTAIQLTPGGGAGPFMVSAAQLAPVLPSIPWTNLPAVAPALFGELFLLDPANVAQLATAAGQTLTEAQLASAAKSMSPPVPVAGHGTPADPLARFPWSQPWRPLYFDWQIQWYPVPFQGSGGSANWTFDCLDYDLVPGGQPPQSQRFEGRTFLTPQPSFQFLSRIRQFVREYPDSPVTANLKSIDNLVETVDGWDFLSQSLSGLGIQLAGWNPVPTATPGATALDGDGTMAELIGAQAGYPPANLLPDPQGEPPPSTFEGMRAGQFYLERVTVVDAFGQALEIVQAPDPGRNYPHTPSGAPFTPLVADGLTPVDPLVTEPPGLVQLPPRILQPARLNLDFLGGHTGNPVIGWLLPNHPDSSVAVYGPDGTAYGALRLGADAAGHPDAVWDAAPGSPWPILQPPVTKLGDLQNLLATLGFLGANALRDFLQAVDETLWTVDPLGARTDTFLSVLIGRPLAVVAAAVSLELQSEPWRDMAWPYTFHDQPPLLAGYQFPVRLGDLGYGQDGLIGYFAEGGYAKFNSVHLPPRGSGDPPLSGYLHLIAPGNYVEVGLGPDGRGPAAKLTLLMDPRAGVHAQCGLLPVVESRLPAQWVDGALAGMAVTFRVGPALAGQQAVTPAQPGAPGTAIVLPRFAEERGVLTWLERDGGNRWTEKAVAPADGTATLPPVAPTLREGLLKLAGGLTRDPAARDPLTGGS